MNAPASPISRAIRDRVVERLGFQAAPAPDVDGLHALYAAWCARVPFDNVRKMIALRTPGAPLPGTTAEDFFEGWLRDGAGGTCWPSSQALWALLSAVGFDARRVVASMRDTGHGSHGTVKVRVDDTDWLVDSSTLTNAPAPCGVALYVNADPVWPVEVEPVDGTHLILVRRCAIGRPADLPRAAGSGRSGLVCHGVPGLTRAQSVQPGALRTKEFRR